MRALSHSSMNLYRECPQRFKFRYVDGIKEAPKHYFSFGQSVHKALEFLYRSQLVAPAIEEVLYHYEANWVKEGYASKEQEQARLEEGRGIIRAYYSKHIEGWKPAMATEFDFTIKIDDADVRGKIDRIDRLPSGNFHVIDYKTGKSFASWRVEKDNQLTLYQMACEETFGHPVEMMTFYHLPSLTPVNSARHPDTLVRNLRKEIISVKTSIERQIFDPKPEDFRCRYCDYKKICPAWTGTPRITDGKRSPSPASIINQLDNAIAKADELAHSLRAMRNTLANQNATDA
ncbi:MAG: PD-(D/E)XK nuclease family protein [Elusimicrobiota bacterium]